MIDATDIAVLRALEESLWRAETRFDRALMERTFAPDFFEIGQSGRIWSRDACLSHASQPLVARLPLAHFQVRLVTADVAHATYVSAVTYDGVEAYAHRSSIWRRAVAGWQLVFHQGTPTTRDALTDRIS
jgi:hypothetical protein